MFAIRQAARNASIRHQPLTRSFTVTSIALSRWTDMVKKTKNTIGIQEITVDELKSELGAAEKPVIIDVREGGEVQRGKIPNAVCLSRGVLELGVEKVVTPESDTPIVVYCAGGLRSIMAVESLVRMGYDNENIKSLKGGFEAWKKGGNSVEN
ncbi:Rhodanese-like domain-containing protein [Zychaea mexicana]|uniref:Rhodanese-like domain-containing protein n=1 Tax=Zychaea mexicana TaxID=64656 RepID=UPI0022FE4CAE|nr:Rhodanese-like domain-containing protein [Zychaea mexicana]KAI9491017.1 Rhodanese-like domain-containing protein [Zychaea mexicana]